MAKMGISSLATVGTAFVVIAIVLGFGALILANVQTEIETETSNTSVSYNATVDGLDAVGDLSGWLPMIALVIIGVFVIGLMKAFGV